MDFKERALAELMDMLLNGECNPEEYTDELLDICVSLLVKLSDERQELLALACDEDAPEKVSSYAKDLIDILNDCAERVYDVKRRAEMSR